MIFLFLTIYLVSCQVRLNISKKKQTNCNLDIQKEKNLTDKSRESPENFFVPSTP